MATTSSDTDMFLPEDLTACFATGNREMMRCLDLADLATRCRVPVMIYGESGSGKSLLARFIHAMSPKRSRPCVTLRCGDMREFAMRERLFGATGESPDGPGGLLGEAGGGTLILDAVDTLPDLVQKELLKILRENTVEDSANPEDGSGVGRRLGVRLVSTSGAGGRAGAGLILEDLLYGLGEMTIRIPPLRERREGIDLLSARALRAAGRAYGKPVPRLSRSARDFLLHYDFPGNVRELFHILDNAVRAGIRDAIYVEDLGLVVESTQRDPHLFSDNTLLPISEMEKRHINLALLRTGWKRTAAARILQISETMLNRKIKLYGLERGR